MDVIIFFVFILNIYRCDNLFGVLCIPGNGNQKLSVGLKGDENEKKVNSDSAGSRSDKKYLPKTLTSERSASSADTSDYEAYKAGEGEVTVDDCDKSDSHKEIGVELSKKPRFQQMIDVELRNINSNDFIISRCDDGIELYKFDPSSYRSIRSILFDGNIIWIKNKHTSCQNFRMFNIRGNNIHLVLTTYEGDVLENNFGITLSNISSNESGSISFDTRYVGFFETLYLLNKEMIDNFYGSRDYKMVIVDINDSFDRIFFKNSRGRIISRPDIQDDSITTTHFEYEVFEGNENELFAQVKYNSKVIWTPLVVGGYVFGARKIEIFTITTSRINNGIKETSDSDSQVHINDKRNNAGNNVRTNTAEAKTKSKPESSASGSNFQTGSNTDKIYRSEVKLIQIMIKNNYYHHLMYKAKENHWEMINKTEFDSLYAKYKLEEVVECIKNDSSTGFNVNGEAGQSRENIDTDGNHIIDISKRNGIFSYSTNNLLKYYVITMSMSKDMKVSGEKNTGSVNRPELASEAGVGNLGEKSDIFQISYGDQFICHVYGTKFTISLVKANGGTSYIEIVNVTNAKNIGESTNATASTSYGSHGSDTQSSTPKSGKSEGSEFSFIDMNDVIFSVYHFKKSYKQDKWEKIDPFNFNYLIIRNPYETSISGNYDYSYHEQRSFNYVADIPIQMKIKLNADSIPSGLKINELDCDSGTTDNVDKTVFNATGGGVGGAKSGVSCDSTCDLDEEDKSGDRSNSSDGNRSAAEYPVKDDSDDETDGSLTNGILELLLIVLLVQIIN